MTAAPAPLQGVRVLDFTHALAGPYCTMLLGDLGADVVKVEPPDGDQARRWGPPFLNGESTYFLSINRNKRSLVLDLKGEAGRSAAQRLARRSDVLVENWKPGTADRLGLGWTETSRANPRLIYASISGFGRSRPTLAGYDQIAQGAGGLMSITGFPDGPPVKTGVPVGDIAAGMFTTHAILAALYQRERGGSGRLIDVSLLDSVLSLLTYQAGRLFATGQPPGREGNSHPTIVPYGTFRTEDGWLNLAVGSDAQWLRFCEVVGATELAADARFRENSGRQKHREEVHGAIEKILATRPTQAWLPGLEQAAIPAGPIYDLQQAFADPIAQERRMRVDLEHPQAGLISVTGTPWKLDGEGLSVPRPPPVLGEHTAEVLAEIG